MTKRGDKIYAALLKLADRFEYGHLLAETQPAEFLEQVCAEIDRLRGAERAKAEAQPAGTGGALGPCSEGRKRTVCPLINGTVYRCTLPAGHDGDCHPVRFRHG